jgi:hypothetical protein
VSTYLAIGGVSATLQKLLKDRMELPSDVTWSDVDITVRTPKPDTDPNDSQTPENSRVNLFLYNVTENAYLKNQEMPGHGHPAAFGQPPLSVNLHYLLTAYGTTSENGSVVTEVRAQQLLGSAMQVLHDHPVITDELTADDGTTILHSSLLGEYERVKLTLDPISLEDLSKVWTALTFPYRLSVAYKVSVVQIESTRPRSFPKLVGKPPAEGPRVVALPLRGPRIDELLVGRAEDPDTLLAAAYARIGDRLVLRGRNLGGSGTKVFVGAVDASGNIVTHTDSEIRLEIPDDPQMQPGTQTVHVAQDVQLGEPPTAHTGFRSNVAAFVLIPQITGAALVGSTLTVTGKRLWSSDSPCTCLVGDIVVDRSEYVAGEDTEVVLEVDLEPGTHSIRVRVNGAESLEDVEVVLP